MLTVIIKKFFFFTKTYCLGNMEELNYGPEFMVHLGQKGKKQLN